MLISCYISLEIVMIVVFILTVSYHNDHFPLKHRIPFSPEFAMCKVLFPPPFPIGTRVAVESAAEVTLNSSLID